MPSPARFRDALEQLGGLYASFGQFLSWRADLLRTDYLGHLRTIRVPVTALPHADVAQILRAELGEAGDGLAAQLSEAPCWNTIARCAYQTTYQDRLIAVQVPRDPVPDREIDAMERGLKLLDEENIHAALQPDVFVQFRQWLRLSDSPARERSYLEAMSPVRGKTVAQYPTLIPEISTERLLCFEWVEGELVSTLIGSGSVSAVNRLAECVLEQICTLSAIDCAFDPDSMVITPDGRLAMRRAERLIAIPPPLVASCLKYISAVFAANAPGAASLLVKLAVGQTSSPYESRLLDELSNLEPELKVNMQFPQSVAIFEGNWRALKRTGVETPLFLDSMHRNLIAVGYWNAEVAAPPAPACDLIAEAQWPVLSRMLRARMGEMANRETGSEWFIGSGLLFFETLRQVSKLAEGLRENDISVGVDLQTGDLTPARGHARIRLGIFIGMLLVVFLVAVRIASTASSPWSGIASVIGAISAVALFWFVSRFD
ncbi:MAG: hypothetical protein ABIZ80_21865 [Bryobacteraceae bacterium]